jgi:hypothetical protein
VPVLGPPRPFGPRRSSSDGSALGVEPKGVGGAEGRGKASAGLRRAVVGRRSRASGAGAERPAGAKEGPVAGCTSEGGLTCRGMALPHRTPRSDGPVDKRVDRTPARGLTVELVPASCWFSNVRSAVTSDEWDVIRRRIYRRATYRCEVCGGRGDAHPVECHEVFDYDDTRLMQTLVDMVALCPACHEVKHIGFAGLRGRDEPARAHLATMNGWDDAQVDEYLDLMFELWELRSAFPWNLDLSLLADYGIAPSPDHDGYVFDVVSIDAASPIVPTGAELKLGR